MSRSVIAPNFSCSDPGLSRDNVTDIAWMVVSKGPSHEHSIIATAAFQILFFLLGIPWNAIVLISILKNHLYKEPTYILLLNLVMGDLLICMCVMPFNIASAIAKEFNIGNSDYDRCQVCHGIVVTNYTLNFISQFTLAIMSVDRLIYLKWPLHYNKIMRVKKVLIVQLVVWLSSILFSLPPVFGFGEIKFSNNLSSCSLVVAGRNHIGPNVYIFFAAAFILSFPFLTTVIANIWQLIIICKSVRSRYNKQMDSTKSWSTSCNKLKDSEVKIKEKYHKQQVHLAKLFGAIFVTNLVTQLPVNFVVIISAIIGADNVPVPLITFVYLTFISKPVIHPMLETCLIGKAKHMIRKCLHCCLCCSRRETP